MRIACMLSQECKRLRRSWCLPRGCIDLIHAARRRTPAFNGQLDTPAREGIEYIRNPGVLRPGRAERRERVYPEHYWKAS